jgi:DNA-binding transcriptional LysR family regulator
MDLLALADFHLVVTLGGIGRASRASGRPKATLSRRVMELEESLGVRLLDRGSCSLRLTEEGSTLHARTKGLLGEIVEVGEAISEGIARPRGRLRIISPLLFAHTSFGPIAAAFIRAYPEVRLEITAEDRAVDPVEEGYDLVIRANPAPDDKLVGRCFLQDQMLIVAPAAMTGPSPASGSDAIVSVPAVVLTTHTDAGIWRIADGRHELNLRPDPVLRLSSKLMIRDAVRAGAGAATYGYAWASAAARRPRGRGRGVAAPFRDCGRPGKRAFIMLGRGIGPKGRGLGSAYAGTSREQQGGCVRKVPLRRVCGAFAVIM